jgi:hypothetical protein
MGKVKAKRFIAAYCESIRHPYHKLNFTSLWLPKQRIQAHVYCGKWVVKRTDEPMHLGDEGAAVTDDIEVTSEWVSYIERIMEAQEEADAANAEAMRLMPAVPQ